jgi:hypothetical protein
MCPSRRALKGVVRGRDIDYPSGWVLGSEADRFYFFSGVRMTSRRMSVISSIA